MFNWLSSINWSNNSSNSFNKFQRDSTLKAGKLTEFKDNTLLNEETTVAITYKRKY